MCVLFGAIESEPINERIFLRMLLEAPVLAPETELNPVSITKSTEF